MPSASAVAPAASSDPEIDELRARCDGASCGACNELGILAMNKDSSPELRYGTRGASAEGATFFQRACDGGCATGCFNRARAVLIGEGVAQDVPAALSAFEAACAKGDARSCVQRGVLYEDATTLPRLGGASLTRDPSKADGLYRKACDAGYGPGCTRRAVLLERGGHADAKTVRGLYDRACTRGDAMGCSNLGLVLEREGDVEGARKRYEQACAARDFTACQNAKALAEGRSERMRTSIVGGYAKE